MHVIMGKKSKKDRSQYELLYVGGDGPSSRKKHAEGSFINLPKLQEVEKEFFELVSLGNVNNVCEFIQDHQGFNVNCQSYHGCTGLQLAVKSGNIEMVKCLIDIDANMDDSLLFAAEHGDCQLVELLLTESSNRRIPTDRFESVEFTADITPLKIAAITDNYKLIRLLLGKGFTVERPHLANCTCEEKCRNVIKSVEGLDQSRARLNAYRALSSSHYICQSSADPILTAFRLSDELRKCSVYEKEYQNEYMTLSRQCEDFAVDLLNQCRTTKEVNMILHREDDGDDNTTEEGITFPRLHIAIECKQKKFVAHPSCQKLLEGTWLKGWENWKSIGTLQRIAVVIPQIVFLPILSFISLVAPDCSVAVQYAQPVNKFISHTASYMFFLVVLHTQNELNKRDFHRGPPSTGLEWPILIFIFSLVWQEGKQLWFNGIKRYFQQWWNWYDLVMYSVFCATFLVWLWAYVDIKQNNNFDMERKLWDQYDPTLIGEGLFAIATIFAYGRILYIFEINQHLGPLQVSISRMFKDIIEFMVIFGMITFSFGTGLNKLYQYYKGQVRIDDNGTTHTQMGSFMTLQSTLKTLFWALFGLSPAESANVVVGNTVGGIRTSNVINKHKFTEGIGYILYGTYNVIAIIVLVNLLIAMMSNSFQKVQDNADIEWKYARTKVWVGFFEGCLPIPPPFNIIPSSNSIGSFIQWLAMRCAGDKRAKCTPKGCWYIIEEKKQKDEEAEKEYQVLMSRLVQRYLANKTKDEDTATPKMSDFNSLLKDVKELKRITKYLTNKLGLKSSSQIL